MNRILIILLLGLPSISVAQKSILFTRETDINLNPYTYYLLDSSGSMTIEEVRKSSELFQLMSDKDGLRLGVGAIVAWLKIRIHNPYDRKEDCVIAFTDPSLYQLTLYQKNGDPLYSGIGTPQYAKNIKGNSNSFILSLYPGETREVIIKVNSENLMTISSSLTDDEHFFQENGKEKTFIGFFYGITFVIIVYSLFLFGLSKLDFFVYYALYIISITLFTGGADGFTPLYIFPLIDITHGYYLFIITGISNILGFLFMRSFLQIPRWSRRLNTIVIYSIYAIIAIVLLPLFTQPAYGFAILLPVGIYSLLIMIIGGVTGTYKKVPEASYFLLAYVMNGFFILLFIMSLFRIVNYTIFVQYSIHFGFILNFLILSSALGVRVYKIYRRNIIKQKVKQKNVEEQNEQLASLVHERTMEISMKENELRAILENSASQIWLINSKFEVLEANESYMESWELAFGFRLEKGKNILDQIPEPGLSKTWKERYEQVFSGKELIIRDEYKVDGNNNVVEIMGFPILEKNKVSKASFFSSDISDRIRYEKQLKRHNRDLQKVNKELDSFVYSASHDLKAPLSSIQGLIFLVRTESDPEIRQKYYEMMDKSIGRLDQFIRDIIDYSRNTRIDVKNTKINLQEMVESIFEDLQYLEHATEFGHIIKINPEITFMSDVTRIRIIMRNLISNALRYGYREEGVNRIEVSAKLNGKKMQIKITDSGKGIDKVHHSKIFEMFYRAHENSSGTGLGLYIVKETLDKLKGDIQFFSDENGTTFIATVPNKSRKQQ